MAKPVIPQGFVLDKSPQENQQVNYKENFGLPVGFQLDDESQSSEPKMSMGEAAFTTATNPLGFGDEIKAGISAGVAKLFGGAATKDIDIGDLYREARTTERAKLDKARQDQPLASFAGQIFSDVGVAGKSLKALGLTGQSFGTAVKGGASLGGTSALGETEDLTNIPQTLKDVATGTAVGGVVGGAVQQALPVVNQVIDKSMSFVKGSAERFKKSTPESIMSKAVQPEEALQEATKLNRKIQEGRITALPEQGNEAILGLTRILGKTQGSNKIIKNYLENKTAGSVKRVGEILNKNISAEGFFDTLDNTIARRKELSTPLYEQAYNEGDIALKQAMSMPSTGNIKVGKVKELINDDRIKNAIQLARKDYGINQEIPDISIQSLHGARQVVDDIIGSAKRAGENNKARSYIDLKNKINNVIYDVAPTMKEADKTFAGFSALKNAQEEGLKFNQYRNSDEVKRTFSKLTDGEKETFRIGVKDYLMDKVAKSSDRNPSKAIFGNQLERKKIQALFDNPKQFTNFAKRLNDEIRVFDTKQRVLGGSRTDFNLTESDQLLDKIAKGAINAKTFGISDILLMTKNAIQKRYYGLNEQTAKELANIIIDPEKSVTLLNNVYKKAQTNTEKGLIQKFTQDFLEKRNFTKTLSPQVARTMVTEQPKNEENLE
jgi:hypothetical protein